MRRRAFLAAALPRRKTVAAIVTEYRYNSHADVICSRMLEGYLPNNIRQEPRTRIVSMFTDQVPKNDLSRGMAAKHGFHIYPSIAEALTLGTGKLAVDAVLLIGEHGNYPTNDRGQKLYPRFDLYERIIDVFKSSGRSVPLFSDKHLSWSWDRAHLMYRQARELGFPFMAGSSIPVTVRFPRLELPLGCGIREGVSVGYADLDAYGFHTIEALQCMVERRRGGETGIRAVEMIEGPRVWEYKSELLDAALSRGFKNKSGRPEDNVKKPALFRLEYNDGFIGNVFMLTGHTEEWMFATRLDGKIVSTAFGSPDLRPLPHFDGLVRCIEEMFVNGREVYPVERTLLTTGALSFLFESRAQKKRVFTPQLKVAYRAPEHCYFQIA
jgi:hypothetical protein